MKTTLTCIALFIAFSSFGQANWHPFPFKVSYFARPDTFGRFDAYTTVNNIFIPPNAPVDHGWVVEALYLDESIQSTGGAILRQRSGAYPTTYEEFPPQFTCIPQIRNSSVVTSADSQMVIFKVRMRVDSVSEIFYPQKHNVGQAAVQGGIVLSKISTETFNLPDSVAVIRTFAGDTLRWSKRFGILNLLFPVCKLIGVNDLGIGWQDVSDVSQPKVDDEYHYVIRSKGETCTPMPGGPSHELYDEYYTLRIKVLAIPYQGNDKALFQMVYSDSGSTTGIEYEVVKYVPNSPEPSSPVGTIVNYSVANSAWIGSNGVTFKTITKQLCSECEIGTLINSCSWLPYQLGYAAIYVINSCESFHFNFQYPVYIKIPDNCESGSPLPPVVITSNKKNKPVFGTLFPNPSQDFVEVETPGQIQNLEVSDATGRIVLVSKFVPEGRFNVSGLPSGLYWIRIQTNEGVLVKRLVKK